MASKATDGGANYRRSTSKASNAATRSIMRAETKQGLPAGGPGNPTKAQSVGNAVTSKMRLPSQAVLSKNAGATALAKARKAPAKAAPKMVKGPITRTKTPGVVQQRVSMKSQATRAYAGRLAASAPTLRGDVPKRPSGPTASKRRSE